MKKFTLFAAMAAVAASASAQYTVDPSTSVVAAQKPTTVEYIVLADAAVAELEAAGAKVTYIGPNPEAGANLWYWEETIVPSEDSYPRVDMEEGGYISVEVTNKGWSGAGLDIQGDGINTTMMNENTRFHLAYRTPTANGPASIAIIIGDGAGSSPGKIALGTAFADQGGTIPAAAPAVNDEWQGLDISFADIKKLWPAFNLQQTENWKGNIFSFLGGGVQYTTFSFDTVYFYNCDGENEDNAVGTVNDDANFVVTKNTVNVNNGQGIELYDLSGRLVKSSNSSVLGIDDLGNGVFVVKSGNSVKKIMK